jgi:hypothetical protein
MTNSIMGKIKQYKYLLIILFVSTLTNIFLMKNYDLKGLFFAYADKFDNQMHLKENVAFLEDYTNNERNNLSLFQTNSALDKLLQSNDSISHLFRYTETLFLFVCPPDYKMKEPVYSFIKSLPCQSVIVKSDPFQFDSLASERIRSVYIHGITDVVLSKRAFCFFINKKYLKSMPFTFYRNEFFEWDIYVKEMKAHIKNKDIL